MSKFCIKCGKELSDGIKFCTNCGTKIETQENYEVKPEPQENQQQNFNYTPNGKLKKIFGCDIKNNADYVKAEKSRKLYINIILICVAVTIILLPFYDKGYWFKPGIVKTLLDGMSALSIASKVVALPVCIIAFIKYNSINKELIRYNTINPNLPKPKNNIKTAVIVLALSIVACLILNPIMEDVDTSAYLAQKDSTSDSAQSSSPVEKCGTGLQFKYTVKEYIEKYNKKTNSTISVNDADISELGLINSYSWKLKNNNLFISEDSETNKIKEIRFFASTKDIGNNGSGFLDNAINAFSIIDNEIDKDKIKDMFDEALSEDNYKNYYHKNGINYVVDKTGMSIEISMLAETEDMAIEDMAIDDTISESGINQSSKSKSSNTSKSTTKSKSTSSSNVATDFEIIGGSSSVDVSSSGKSYSITCPYCGYSSNSLSTQDIQSEISKHKPGDEKNIGGSFMCASQFQGGCREVSDYYVTVKFK